MLPTRARLTTRMTREPGGQLCLANVMLLVLATGSRC